MNIVNVVTRRSLKPQRIRSGLQQRSGGKPAELKYQGRLYRKTQEAFDLHCPTPESKDQSLATIVYQLPPRARVKPLTEHPQNVILHPAPEAKDVNRAVPFHLRICATAGHLYTHEARVTALSPRVPDLSVPWQMCPSLYQPPATPQKAHL